MNEQHFDALPPVNLSQQPDPQATQPDGKVPLTNPSVPPVTPVADPAVQASPDPLSAPGIADDVDLIEKEWVERAKQIVEQTKHDPYKQNEEMTRMKTDYLKKRYNRDIKISEA